MYIININIAEFLMKNTGVKFNLELCIKTANLRRILGKLSTKFSSEN